jgi:hypothetical protein
VRFQNGCREGHTELVSTPKFQASTQHTCIYIFVSAAVLASESARVCFWHGMLMLCVLYTFPNTREQQQRENVPGALLSSFRVKSA